MTQKRYTEIPKRQKCINKEEPYIGGAKDIIDDELNKPQSQVNDETNQRVSTLEESVGTGGSVDERIAEEGAKHYLKTETYSKTELNNMITTPNQEYVSVTATSQTTAATDVLPATGEADTTYRVGNWDGTQYNDSVFSEYAWNGSAYIKLSTKSQVGEVYDISANHADTKYADLAAALGENGVNVPVGVRRGGMSVKFVQTSDNKYIQARCMAQNFTTDVTQWQVVDDKPTAVSKNLVESGGIYNFGQEIRSEVASSFLDEVSQIPVTELTWQMGLIQRDGTISGTNPNFCSVIGVYLTRGSIISANSGYTFIPYIGGTAQESNWVSSWEVPSSGVYGISAYKSGGTDIPNMGNYITKNYGFPNVFASHADLEEVSSNDMERVYLLRECINAPLVNLETEDVHWQVGILNTSTMTITNTNPKFATLLGVNIEKGYYIGLYNTTEYKFAIYNSQGTVITGDQFIYNDFKIETTGKYYVSVYREAGNVDLSVVRTIIGLKQGFGGITPEIVQDKIAYSSDLYGAHYCSEGDSIAWFNGKNVNQHTVREGYTADTGGTTIKGYQSYAVDKYKMILTNNGVNGSTIGVGEDPNRCEYNNMMARDYSSFKLITIEFGTNDHAYNVPLGELGTHNESTHSTTTFTGAYRNVLDHIIAQNPDCNIILCTPVKCDNYSDHSSDNQNDNGNTLSEFANRIKEIAELYGLQCCDWFTKSGINIPNMKAFTVDGIHPNNQGYAKMSKEFLNILNILS